MSQQKSRKAAGELMKLYFELKDFIDEHPEHPNFLESQRHLRMAMLWAKEGIGVVNHIGEEV